MSDRCVLVTGAAGFIGSHLCEALLARGFGVIGLDNFCDFYDPSRKRRNVEGLLGRGRFDLIEADIQSRQRVLEVFATRRPDTVVHLAAMAGVRPSIEQPAYYAAVNVTGTVNVLDAAAAHGVERFVFASSSSVYGNNPKVPFAEDDPVDHPISPYAATKKAGELICHTYHHLHGLPTACLRLFTVFGPRQRPDLAIGKFLRLLAEDRPIPIYGDGSTSRDYTYVDDIVAGVLSAMDWCRSTRGYGVFNLGGSTPVTLRELVETIERVTGRKARIQSLSPQAGDVERTWADLSRSGAALGYQPQVPLEEGIARQWEWFWAQGA